MPSPNGYTRLQIALHWGAALLILQQYLLKDAIAAAWDATTMGLNTAFDPRVLAHVAGGVLVMLFALWRIAIKVRRGTPVMVGDIAVQRALAGATHVGLYALMILMPLSGSLAWFGRIDLAAQAHNVLKVVVLALVALHMVGALYHQFVPKDGLINRMRRVEG